MDLESLKHDENPRDKTASIEGQLTFASPYQNIEKQVVENDISDHAENSPLNVNINLNSDRTHNTRPKVSFIFNPLELNRKSVGKLMKMNMKLESLQQFIK